MRRQHWQQGPHQRSASQGSPWPGLPGGLPGGGPVHSYVQNQHIALLRLVVVVPMDRLLEDLRTRRPHDSMEETRRHTGNSQMTAALSDSAPKARHLLIVVQ